MVCYYQIEYAERWANSVSHWVHNTALGVLASSCIRPIFVKTWRCLCSLLNTLHIHCHFMALTLFTITGKWKQERQHHEVFVSVLNVTELGICSCLFCFSCVHVCEFLSLLSKGWWYEVAHAYEQQNIAISWKLKSRVRKHFVNTVVCWFFFSLLCFFCLFGGKEG